MSDFTNAIEDKMNQGFSIMRQLNHEIDRLRGENERLKLKPGEIVLSRGKFRAAWDKSSAGFKNECDQEALERELFGVSP